jgi:hypothetical protein
MSVPAIRRLRGAEAFAVGITGGGSFAGVFFKRLIARTHVFADPRPFRQP